MNKVSLRSQIAAVEATAGERSAPVHPGQRQLQKEHLQAAAATLRWLEANEATVRDAIGREART